MSLTPIPDHLDYRCIVCSRPIFLDSVVARTTSAPPMDAVMFSTNGNWGSSVLDGDAVVHGVICDKCMVSRDAHMLVEVPVPGEGVKYVLRWQPVPLKDPNHQYSQLEMIGIFLGSLVLPLVFLGLLEWLFQH